MNENIRSNKLDAVCNKPKKQTNNQRTIDKHRVFINLRLFLLAVYSSFCFRQFMQCSQSVVRKF